MRRFLIHARPLCMALTLTALMIGLVPLPAVKAQTANTPPLTVYRWRVSDSNKGFMLHQSLSAGQNLGYYNEGSVFETYFPSSQRAGIVPPQPPGYTPAPGNPLIPIYQWRVVQGGRTYYYYAGAGFGGGPGYYFEGQLGWVLPANYQQGSAIDPSGHPIYGTPVNYYYSTSKGYWYTSFRPDLGGPILKCFPDACHPGNTSYVFQGVGFQLPMWDPGSFQSPPTFNFLPPPPPPSCDPVDEQACYNNGGSWNSSTCSCNYFEPDPEPCRPGMICEAYSPTQQTAKPAAPEPAPEPPPLK